MDEYSAWDLFRRGHLDQEKHLKILRDMIKKNITDLVTHGEIVAGDSIVIPVKHLRQYKFVYEDPGEEGTIMVDGDVQEGDKLGRRPQKSKGKSGEGEGDGGHYEVVVNADHVAEILFQDLELPDLKEKEKAESYQYEVKKEGIKKKGPLSNLAKRRTIVQNIKRNASKGDPEFKDIVDDDLRFDANVLKRTPQDKVAVLFVRDRSGSMDEEKKHLTRVMAFWIIKFLEYKYKKVVDKSYVIFDTKAEEVDEEQFITISEGGGTTISSGLTLAEKIINKDYPPDAYNIYTFLFTDGDNFSSDNEKSAELIKNLAAVNNLFGLVHVNSDSGYYSYNQDNRFIKEIEKADQPNVVITELAEQGDVMDCMKAFFSKKGG